MSKRALLSSAAAPFAHLLGIRTAKPSAGKKADEEKKDQTDARAEGDEEEDGEKKPDSKKKGEGDKPKETDDEGDRASAEEDDGEDDGDEEKKPDARKAKKAEDDEEAEEGEDDDEQMKAARAEGVRAGRKAERARCEAVFLSPHAGARPDLAAQLAFRSRMSAEEAVGVLAAAAAGSKPAGLAARMADVRNPDVGAGAPEAPANGANAVAASMLAASKKARGEK